MTHSHLAPPCWQKKDGWPRCARHDDGLGGAAGTRSSSLKKEEKTLIHLALGCGSPRAKLTKFFCFFLFTKRRFFPSPS
jgi:hypothetical protein